MSVARDPMGSPNFRYHFQLWDGTSIMCSPLEAKRTLDRRTPFEAPKVVWEVNEYGKPLRRIWPEELMKWQQIEL